MLAQKKSVDCGHYPSFVRKGLMSCNEECSSLRKEYLAPMVSLTCCPSIHNLGSDVMLSSGKVHKPAFQLDRYDTFIRHFTSYRSGGWWMCLNEYLRPQASHETSGHITLAHMVRHRSYTNQHVWGNLLTLNIMYCTSTAVNREVEIVGKLAANSQVNFRTEVKVLTYPPWKLIDDSSVFYRAKYDLATTLLYGCLAMGSCRDHHRHTLPSLKHVCVNGAVLLTISRNPSKKSFRTTSYEGKFQALSRHFKWCRKKSKQWET